MRRTFALTALLALPLGTLAACGGDDDGGDDAGPSGSAPEGAVVVHALDSLAFDEEAYSAPAGEITFVYENDGSLPHTLLVDGIDGDEFKLEVGDTDEGAVTLEAGEYVLYCDVAGHRDAGMEADLTVE
jgi:plastocyanin